MGQVLGVIVEKLVKLSKNLMKRVWAIAICLFIHSMTLVNNAADKLRIIELTFC